MQCDKAQTARNMTSIRGITIGFFLCFQIRTEVVRDREGSIGFIVERKKRKKSGHTRPPLRDTSNL